MIRTSLRPISRASGLFARRTLTTSPRWLVPLTSGPVETVNQNAPAEASHFKGDNA